MVILEKKVREEYKMTDFGEIPLEWELTTIGNISNKIMDGTHTTPLYKASGIPFYSVENVTNNEFKKTKFISKSAHEINSKRCLVEKNDILMTRIGKIGQVKLIDWDVNASIYVSLALIKLKDAINSRYVYQFMKSQLFISEALKRSLLNAAPPKINLGDIYSIPVLLPASIQEQQKIAEILSTVDEQLENTDELIEKIKELKKGLMQQLLTKGIGHNKFKQTELGEIPVSWEVVELKNAAEIIMGQSPSSSSYNDEGEGLPFYQGKTEFGYMYPNVKKWCSQPTKIAEADDVLFSVRAPVGEVNICEEKSCIGRGLGAIRSIDGKSVPWFLFYTLQNSTDKFNSLSQGSAFTAINGGELRSFKISFPRFQEQQKIAEILSEVDEHIESYEIEKEKYMDLKKGLMQNLLTGKIRVAI